MTTGTAGGEGWYQSPQVTIYFNKTFSAPPAVIMQENGGNGVRFYRYRVLAIDPSGNGFSAFLMANAPSYYPPQGYWIAIGENNWS